MRDALSLVIVNKIRMLNLNLAVIYSVCSTSTGFGYFILFIIRTGVRPKIQ